MGHEDNKRMNLGQLQVKQVKVDHETLLTWSWPVIVGSFLEDSASSVRIGQ